MSIKRTSTNTKLKSYLYDVLYLLKRRFKDLIPIQAIRNEMSDYGVDEQTTDKLLLAEEADYVLDLKQANYREWVDQTEGITKGDKLYMWIVIR